MRRLERRYVDMHRQRYKVDVSEVIEMIRDEINHVSKLMKEVVEIRITASMANSIDQPQ